MSKFVWRLQRLLDVKIKQEDVIRAGLVVATERAVAVRGKIMMCRAELRGRLTDLNKKDASERLGAQQLFLQFSQVTEKTINKLRENLKELEKLRRKKIEELMEARRFRKGLEKIREKAMEEFLSEERKRQQRQLDEDTSRSFARKILKRADHAHAG